MIDYRIIAIPTATAVKVRATQKAPRYNHPAYTEAATGYGPCRHCLRTFVIGTDRRTLFTYDPFAGIEQIPLPGPIFIHAESCERYPEDAGYPKDLLPYSTVLNAYAKGQTFLERLLVPENGEHEKGLVSLFERPDTDYIEVRSQTAGCFTFRAERATAPGNNKGCMCNHEV